MNDHIRVGVLAGFQPRFTDSAFQSKGSKFGAFVTYEHMASTGLHPRTTVAFVRQHAEGRIQRDVLYVQSNLPLKTLHLYQTSEFILNRVGRREPQLANTYLSLNYTPVSAISLTASYDTWKIIPEREAGAPATDSLFVETLYQGVRFDLQLRPVRSLRMYGRVSTRMKSRENSRTTTGTVGVGVWNTERTGFAYDVRYTVVKGPFVEAHQLDMSLSHLLYRSAYLTGDFQRYHLSSVGGTVRLQIYGQAWPAAMDLP